MTIKTLKEIRESLGKTQPEMAEVLGMKAQTYRYKEWGKTQLKYNELIRLSEASGVPVEEIDGTVSHKQ